MKLTKKAKKRIRIIAGIIAIIGLFLFLLFLIICGNNWIENIFTENNIKCLDYCFYGKNFTYQWVCNC